MNKQITLIVLYNIFSTLAPAASSEPVFSKKGMVVSTSRQAAEAGIEILKKGGNAVDAAVAVGFALAVTSSGNGNIGGGGFMVAAMANGDRFSIDHREKAPAEAHRGLFLNDSGDVVPGMSLSSRAGSGVPGTVDGLILALEDYGSGKISIQALIGPAIDYAENGFKLSKYEARRFNNMKSFLSKHPETKRIFTRNDREWKRGDIFYQKDLAKTLKRIVKKGRDGFYKGRREEKFY